MGLWSYIAVIDIQLFRRGLSYKKGVKTYAGQSRKVAWVSSNIVRESEGRRSNCDDHIFIPFAFSQFTSFHSVFHSFHALMTSINWPASSILVFIAQLVEHYSTNTEATGSNPVEAPQNVFSFRATSQLNCD